MERRRRFAWICVIAALALAIGPGARLYAATPCHAGAPMSCCAGDAEGAPAPCGCMLNSRTPAPGVVETSAPDAVPACEPSPALEISPAAPEVAPALAALPIARAGPLVLLFSSLRN